MFNKRNQKQNKTNGFTLIELLVVISIVGLMSSVLLTSVNVARIKAKNARWQGDVEQMSKAYELYYSDFGRYPFSAGTLPVAALSSYVSLIPSIFTSGEGSYFSISRAPTDPIWIAISDDASACVYIHNGFIIAVGAEGPSNGANNDGGIEPNYYERWGGDVTIHSGATPGFYNSSNCTR